MSNTPVAKAKSRFLMTYSSLFLLGPTLQPSRCCARRKISKLLEPGCFFVLAPSFPLGTGGTFAMEPVMSELYASTACLCRSSDRYIEDARTKAGLQAPRKNCELGEVVVF